MKTKAFLLGVALTFALPGCSDKAETLAYDRCLAWSEENLNQYGTTRPGRLTSYCDDNWERFWRENDKADSQESN